MKKITKIISLSIGSLLGAFTSTIRAFATNIDCNDTNIPEVVREANGCTSNSDDLPTKIIAIINAVIGVLGLVAVIYVIYGGVQYMTSAGDASKAKKAKDAILYACIGLIVCILAFAIVNFVIANFVG